MLPDQEFVQSENFMGDIDCIDISRFDNKALSSPVAGHSNLAF